MNGYLRTASIFAAAAWVLFCAAGLSPAATPEAGALKPVPLSIPVKRLLAEPDEKSRVTYEIPINVKILGRTPDRKWYKARISYDFLGHCEFEGWLKAE